MEADTVLLLCHMIFIGNSGKVHGSEEHYLPTNYCKGSNVRRSNCKQSLITCTILLGVQFLHFDMN